MEWEESTCVGWIKGSFQNVEKITEHNRHLKAREYNSQNAVNITSYENAGSIGKATSALILHKL